VGLHLLSLWSNHVELIEKAEHYLERVSLSQRRDAPASELSHGEQRRLEVAILLALEPKVLMFDEPTAGMSMDEVPIVLDLIRAIKEQGDRTVLLVEHKLEVVRSLADRIVVLHDGRLVADGDPAQVMASPLVQQAYMGAAIDV
jgi:branched-chain amino acid transport system ATP-binding protein